MPTDPVYFAFEISTVYTEAGHERQLFKPQYLLVRIRDQEPGGGVLVYTERARTAARTLPDVQKFKLDPLPFIRPEWVKPWLASGYTGYRLTSNGTIIIKSIHREPVVTCIHREPVVTSKPRPTSRLRPEGER